MADHSFIDPRVQGIDPAILGLLHQLGAVTQPA